LILNNGLFLAESLIEDIHGLLIEELFFTVDSAGRYDVRPMKLLPGTPSAGLPRYQADVRAFGIAPFCN